MADTNQKIKMALISGAAHALKYKQENPRASDAEIIKRISNEARVILDKINKEE